MKPIFSDKKSYNININLIENNNIVTEDIKIAECFKNHFENSVKVLILIWILISYRQLII